MKPQKSLRIKTKSSGRSGFEIIEIKHFNWNGLWMVLNAEITVILTQSHFVICERTIHTECSDLNSSELEVMSMTGKRLLIFFCCDCIGVLSWLSNSNKEVLPAYMKR